MTNVLEIWKDVPEYEGKYQASNLGRIRSLDRPGKRGKWQTTLYGKILKQSITNCGYLVVNLDGKSVYAHRVILTTFGGKKNIGECSLHLNDNKKDNRISNLKWGSYRENTLSAIQNKLYIHGRLGKHGAQNPQSIPVVQFSLDGKLISEYESLVEAHKASSIDQCSISKVCRGFAKTAGGYVWLFKTA